MKKNRSGTVTLLTVFEAVGWFGVAIGIIVFIVELTNSGSSSYDQPATSDSLSMANAVVFALSGLWLVALARIGIAVIDIAESNDAILAATDPAKASVSEQSQPAPRPTRSLRPVASDDKPLPPDVAEEIHGIPIYIRPDGKFRAMGVDFDTHAEARLHIFGNRI